MILLVIPDGAGLSQPRVSSETVGRPMEVLLVEDSLMSARLTIGALKKSELQHRMSWLRDGQEAMEFLRQQGKYARAPRPDLILLDLGLPKMDGRELLERIRADEHLKSIPVIVLTASFDEADMARTEQLQVESYLTKPIDLEAFMNVVRRLARFWHEDMILPSR